MLFGNILLRLKRKLLVTPYHPAEKMLYNNIQEAHDMAGTLHET